MEIGFETDELRSVVEEKEAAENLYGVTTSSKLRARIADITAAKVVSDLNFALPRTITYQGANCICLDIFEDIKMIICSNHPKMAKLETIDWSKVKRVRILKIGKVDA